MNEIRFYKRPWFKSLVLGIFLLGIYVYDFLFQGGLWHSLFGISFDLFMFLFILWPACVFFYAQFILPVNTWKDRNKIVSRLWLHAGKIDGPAIFVQNGRLVERKEESKKKGPGVLWLDTASAVATRTDTAFKNFLGPGVHFTDKDEKIASVIGLHTQNHRIGPDKDDKPFDLLKENPTEEEQKKYQETQDRLKAVSAMTRDGIQVVPNISVTFKIDAEPAKGAERGSRFGFHKDSIEKAARGEGISASSKAEEVKHIAWNQLPALIAADLWREYLSKFTLDELFSASLEPLNEVLQPESSIPIENHRQILMPGKSGFFTRLLKQINNSFEGHLKKLVPEEPPIADKEEEAERQLPHKKTSEQKPQTALQIINQMIKARMTQAAVPILDESGRQVEGFSISEEFDTLTERGIKVHNVSVSNLRFSPAIEKQIVQQWKTNWLINAKADQSRIERLNAVTKENGRQKALQDHALTLSEAVLNARTSDLTLVVKALLQGTQNEIKLNDRLLRRTTTEVEDMESIINWLESI
ncbi:MAG: hypothetical protein HY258_12820 [Chloroflexi bacterium]|nr:hypothetical protein [Chloroflexota bacterium]